MTDLGRRVRNLRALAGEHMPGQVDEAFGALVCDRCGHVEELTEQEANSGVLGDRFNQWGHGPEGDLCPACAVSLPLTPEQAAVVNSAFERARDVLFAVPAPSEELQQRVARAAAAVGAKAACEQYVSDDGRTLWRAVVETPRGTASTVVKEGIEDPWEDAFRELGLLD